MLNSHKLSISANLGRDAFLGKKYLKSINYAYNSMYNDRWKLNKGGVLDMPMKPAEMLRYLKKNGFIEISRRTK